MNKISFEGIFSHETSNTTSWLQHCLTSLGTSQSDVTYVSLSDSEMLELNTRELGHNFITDIITYDLSEPGQGLVADIYICPEQIRRNSVEYDSSFVDEMRRVLIHGILHLHGYKDDTEEQQTTMRNEENKFLAI